MYSAHYFYDIQTRVINRVEVNEVTHFHTFTNECFY